VSPSESSQEYFVDVDGIFFDAWVGIFCDVEKYFATWPWMNEFFWMKKWMINKMDDFFNGCQTYEKSWMSHYLIHIGWNYFMLVLL
jgi:hypothetical protein